MNKLKSVQSVEPEISLAYLKDIADGSQEFMVEMIDIFLHQTPGYLAQLETSIEKKDWTTVAEIAHKVRPTFTFIGVDQLTQIMASIEQKARTGEDLASISKIFNEIKPLLTRVLEKLAEMRKELAQ